MGVKIIFSNKNELDFECPTYLKPILYFKGFYPTRPIFSKPNPYLTH